MLSRSIANSIRKMCSRRFSILIDYQEFLVRDEQQRSFYNNLLKDDPQREFEKPLNEDQIEYVNLVYEAFFQKMELEDKNLFIMKQLFNDYRNDDKGFIKSTHYISFITFIF